MSDYKTLLCSREGNIAFVSLNRPNKRNALSNELRYELDDCLGALAADNAVSVVILMGEGPIFCAGFDKSEFGMSDPAKLQALRDSSEKHHRRLADFPKPLIAGIQGAALGGGFDVAVLCDLRIATSDAVFAHPEIKFGAPALFGPLREIVGGGLARELILTGRKMDATEALRVGLISRLVEPAELRSACLQTAKSITESPLVTLKAMKKQIIASYGGWNGFHTGGDGLFDFS